MIQRVRQALTALRPGFWHQRSRTSPYQTFSNYKRIWFLSIILLTVASVLPLGIMALVGQQLITRTAKTENALRTIRLTSNARRSVAHFLKERLDALKFTIREVPHKKLEDPDHLAVVLKNLKLGFGGFSDLGVIDHTGRQVAYTGPFDLVGVDYSSQPWFLECSKRGIYVSDVFLGYRNVPHIIIAIKSPSAKGGFHILRATLDTERLIRTLSAFNPGRHADVFLINREGVVQTPSSRYGKVLRKADLDVPQYSARTRSFETVDKNGRSIVVGHAHISTGISDTPFILMVVKQRSGMMTLWSQLRRDLAWFLGLSLFVILVIVVLTSTYMVNKVYESDRTKAGTMLRMEQTSRLASIGRLAAGVAHEINNPLAVINEEAGYLKDLSSFGNKETDGDEQAEHVDSILESVARCADVTKQLLGFARHFQVETRPVHLLEIINEVLSFCRKEAEYRNIGIAVDVPDNVPRIVSDRGKLQQVFLNLVNNSFHAMKNGGRLEILASMREPGEVLVEISDTGCGIPEKDLEKVFEPFYTTKEDEKGTGLGLSITYGLVRKLKGRISVRSKVGEGTTFTVTLPLTMQEVDTP